MSYIAILFVGTGLAIGFNNCSGSGFQAEKLQVLSQSSQCVAQKIGVSEQRFQLVSGGQSKIQCAEAGNYLCDKKVYSPNLAYSEQTVMECFTSESLNQICLDVKTFNYSTAKMLQDPSIPENAFAEGGEYNYTEYRCSFVADKNVYLFTSSAASLETALALSQANCLDLPPLSSTSQMAGEQP